MTGAGEEVFSMRKMLFPGLAAVTTASLLVAATALATESAKTSARSAVVRISTRKLPKLAKAVATGKAKAALLGSDRNPAGGRVVTYSKWPLYTYVADTAPGQAKGQALNLNGGLWYVLSPSGKVIRTK